MEKTIKLIAALFGCRLGHASHLSLVGTGSKDPGRMLTHSVVEHGGAGRYVDASLCLVIVGEEDEDVRVRDIKEQVVTLVSEKHLDHPYLEELLMGWALAVEFVIDNAPNIETLMPSDFAPPRSLFTLKKARTAGDYHRACFAKGRLGKFLPQGLVESFFAA